MHQHVTAVAVVPVAGGHLRSPHARTRVDWCFVRYGGLQGGYGGEGPGLVVIIIIIDRGARGRGGPEAVAARTAIVALAAAVMVAAAVVAV